MAGPHTQESGAELVRAIGLGSATLLVVGSVVGSGIFLTTGIMAERIPSASLLLAAWTLGGLLSLAGGLTFAELAGMYPRSGGLYVFLREAYGPVTAFLYGWTALLVVVSGSTAAVAVGFAEYLSYFAPALSVDSIVATIPVIVGRWSISAGQIVAAVSIVALGAVNYVGVRSGNLTNVVLTVAKVAGLAALPVLALALRPVDPVFTPVIPDGLSRPLASFGVAMIAVFWTYEAWYYVTYAGDEIKDAPRTLPRALLLGTLVLTVIYVTVNLAYFYALELDEMRGVLRIAERAASALVGPGGATFVALTVVISTLGANAAGMLAGSRVLFAIARDGLFFPSAGVIHPRYRTPHVAIAGLTTWSAVLALSGSYEQLFTYVVFASILFNMAVGLAVFRLRKTRPEVHRPYRTWGYPVVPLVFVVGSLAFVFNTLMERPLESVAGLGLVVLGLPAYWYWRKRPGPRALESA